MIAGSERSARYISTSYCDGECNTMNILRGYGGNSDLGITIIDFSNLWYFLRTFFALALETHFSAFFCNFNSLFKEIMI